MNYHAIYALYPNVVQIFEDDGINIKVGAFDIEGKQVEIDSDLVEAWIDPIKYQRDRATEYPAIAEQLDEIYHNGIDSWKAVIKVTKDKYPKPE